jgi:hypothetical protein
VIGIGFNVLKPTFFIFFYSATIANQREIAEGYTNPPENYEIFYRKSVDEGASFESEFLNLSNNAGFSYVPSVASVVS